MHGISATGDRLEPITRTEAVALADGLQRHARKDTAVAKQPLFVLFTRLIASLPENTNAVLADRDARLALANQTCDELREQLSAAQNKAPSNDQTHLVKQLRRDLEAANIALRISEKRVQARERDLQGLEILVDREGEALRSRITEMEKEKADLTESLSKVMEEAATRVEWTNNTITKLTKCVEEEEAERKKVQKHLEDLRTRVKTSKKALDKAQWSGRHYTFRDDRGKASCCPICQGLSPKYQHRDVGHDRQCPFVTLEAALKP